MIAVNKTKQHTQEEKNYSDFLWKWLKSAGVSDSWLLCSSPLITLTKLKRKIGERVALLHLKTTTVCIHSVESFCTKIPFITVVVQWEGHRWVLLTNPQDMSQRSQKRTETFCEGVFSAYKTFIYITLLSKDSVTNIIYYIIIYFYKLIQKAPRRE